MGEFSTLWSIPSERSSEKREKLKLIVHPDTNATGIYREVCNRDRVLVQSAARLLHLSEIIRRWYSNKAAYLHRIDSVYLDEETSKWGHNVRKVCREKYHARTLERKRESKDKIGFYLYWHVRPSVQVKIVQRLPGFSFPQSTDRSKVTATTVNWTHPWAARSRADPSLSGNILHLNEVFLAYSRLQFSSHAKAQIV